MIVTITQFESLHSDDDGNVLPLGQIGMPSEARATAGAFAALNVSTNFIRVASDTAVKLTDAGGRVVFIPANVPEYFGAAPGTVFTLATV